MKLEELREMFSGKSPEVAQHPKVIPAKRIKITFDDIARASVDFANIPDTRAEIINMEARKRLDESVIGSHFTTSPSRLWLLSTHCDGVLSPCGEIPTNVVKALPMHTPSGEAENWYLCERCEKEYKENWLESCSDWDLLSCENCRTKPARTIPALTRYPWDGTGEDPNRPLDLCFRCSRDYVEHWKNMWGEYASTRF